MRTIRAVAVAVTTTAVMCLATTVWAADDVPTETTVTTQAPSADGPAAEETPEPTPQTTVAVSVPDDDSAPVTITVDPGAAADESQPPADDVTTTTGDDSASTADGSTTTSAAVAATTTTNAQVTHTEEVVVSGTQVAQANTGGNVTQNGSTPDSGSVALGGDIDSGNAAAVGSRDQNSVNQEADVILTGEATANIVQIALILNIGAALANSGYNMIDSQPGGSSNPSAIATGDASATGNDMDQYATQLAATQANAQMDDFANQLAVSLWLGVAQSNSGLNVSSGTGISGSAGGIGAGSASAIGNDSITAIDQQAAVNGSGTSVSNIAQRATVLNLGFAVANSGFNDITGIASNLLSAGDDNDDALAQDMFAMLLPALLSANGYGPGAGTIATGDAAAVGNRSETYTRQIAHATSSGDGMASIVQDILIANVGVAGANTGVNVLGGGYRSLDPQTAETVVRMAAFLASLLSVIHQASFSTQVQAQQLGIEVPFGDLIIQVGSVLSGVDTSITSASGARVNLRQVSLVLSLGISRANTGYNVATTTQVQGDPAVAAAAAPAALESSVTSRQALAANSEEAAAGVAATLAAVDRQVTGPATAANNGVIVICQRVNWANANDCLTPPVPTPPLVEPPTSVSPDNEVIVTTPEPAPTTTTMVVVTPARRDPRQGLGAPTQAELPSTGADVGTFVLIGSIGVLAGLAMLMVGRRKRDDRVTLDGSV